MIQPIVFIIESPSATDVLDGRTEGEALSAALRLSNIPNQYFRAVNVRNGERMLFPYTNRGSKTN